MHLLTHGRCLCYRTSPKIDSFTVIAWPPKNTHMLLQTCVTMHVHLPFPCSLTHPFACTKQYALLNVCNHLQNPTPLTGIAHTPALSLFPCPPICPHEKKHKHMCTGVRMQTNNYGTPLPGIARPFPFTVHPPAHLPARNINIPPSPNEEAGQICL
jgi:hypothetical protein